MPEPIDFEAKTRINRAMKCIGKLEAKLGTVPMPYNYALEVAALIDMIRGELLGKRIEAKEALREIRTELADPIY